MKILMVNSSRNWGGAEQLLLSLAVKLRQKGHDIGFFLRKDSVAVQRFTEAGFSVWCGRRKGTGFISSIFKLAMIMRRERFDAIHLHRNHDVIPTALANIAGGQIPMVLTQHAWQFSKSFLQYLIWGALTKVVAVSGAVAEELRKAYPYTADKTVVIPNGIPVADSVEEAPNYWQKHADLIGKSPLLGIVGFFHKNQQELVGLLPKIRESFPDIVLIIIGPIDDRKQIFEEQARQLGVLDALYFAGFIPHEEMHAALGGLDLNISMHRHEPFGLHVVEGMAAGTPLVAYRAGGFPEIVEHNRNGYLAESPEELQQAVCELLRDKGLREKMGQSGRKRVLELFTDDTMASAYEALYRQLKH